MKGKRTSMIMPRPNPPCMKCQDRHVKDDGRTCHADCEKYKQFKDDRYEVWKEVSKKASDERLLDSVCVDMALKNSRKKRKER